LSLSKYKPVNVCCDRGATALINASRPTGFTTWSWNPARNRSREVVLGPLTAAAGSGPGQGVPVLVVVVGVVVVVEVLVVVVEPALAKDGTAARVSTAGATNAAF
jgi:hypothetical protein